MMSWHSSSDRQAAACAASVYSASMSEPIAPGELGPTFLKNFLSPEGAAGGWKRGSQSGETSTTPARLPGHSSA